MRRVGSEQDGDVDVVARLARVDGGRSSLPFALGKSQWDPASNLRDHRLQASAPTAQPGRWLRSAGLAHARRWRWDVKLRVATLQLE